ncbi:MAG: cytochrome d ubiquinol oxidase subunit II [Acidobacteria bacterium]|nr:cytochrome d ubiquinol oxidase subunit II [Acidobacteriota bacterium]
MNMETLWFCLVALTIAAYVILDGFDLGAGAVHFLLGKNSEERETLLETIGPFWDGNEVWLLAGGGTLYFAFPTLYASAFEGFYLPLMMVLWLLILRGIAIEFRHQMHDVLWTPAWDAVFCGASAALPVFFGAALGNVVRGVPLDSNREFFLPLWTNFRVSAEPGVLDWYTILVGLLALAALAMHGALWIRLKTYEPIAGRAASLASRLWVCVAALTAIVTVASFQIRPALLRNFVEHPWGFVFPALALGGLALAGTRKSFLASCGYLAGMLCSVVFSVYPEVLPASPGHEPLTVHNAAAPDYGLRAGLVWWIPGLILAIGYATFLYRRFSGKAGKPAATSNSLRG